MTYDEHLKSDWNPWLRGKSRLTIEGIAKACEYPIDPDAKARLREALYNACKIYIHTLEIETRKDLGDRHNHLHNQVFENPKDASALLTGFESAALKDK